MGRVGVMAARQDLSGVTTEQREPFEGDCALVAVVACSPELGRVVVLRLHAPCQEEYEHSITCAGHVLYGNASSPSSPNTPSS